MDTTVSTVSLSLMPHCYSKRTKAGAQFRPPPLEVQKCILYPPNSEIYLKKLLFNVTLLFRTSNLSTFKYLSMSNIINSLETKESSGLLTLRLWYVAYVCSYGLLKGIYWHCVVLGSASEWVDNTGIMFGGLTRSTGLPSFFLLYHSRRDWGRKRSDAAKKIQKREREKKEGRRRERLFPERISFFCMCFLPTTIRDCCNMWCQY